ncbi:hypothetical protein [Maribacter litopenaei]|uniref:hypothetical protein n=1 Tax=Maribacter litopenaei TaxID=2976127 RepID=UPI0030841A26
MKGDDFIGHRPSNVFWAVDQSAIYFNWNPEMAFSDSLYGYNLGKKNIEKIDFLEAEKLPSTRKVDHPSLNKSVYAKNGDIFILDNTTGKTLAITNTKERESNPHFTDNDKKVAFINGSNVFTWDMETGVLEQRTDFVDKLEEEPKRSTKDEWLYQDQLELFGVLRERKEKRELGETINKTLEVFEPLPIATGSKRVVNQMISPNGRFVTYVLMDSKKNKNTMVPHFVTESGYTEEQTTRTKVGDELPKYEMFVYDTQKRTKYPVVLDSLEGLNEVP